MDRDALARRELDRNPTLTDQPNDPDPVAAPEEEADEAQVPRRSPFVPSPEYRSAPPLEVTLPYTTDMLKQLSQDRGQVMTAIKLPGGHPSQGNTTVRDLAPLLMSYQESLDAIAADMADGASRRDRIPAAIQAGTSMGVVAVLAASFVVVLTPSAREGEAVSALESLNGLLDQTNRNAFRFTDELFGRYSNHTAGKMYKLLQQIEAHSGGIGLDVAESGELRSTRVPAEGARSVISTMNDLPPREAKFTDMRVRLVAIHLRKGSFELETDGNGILPRTVKGRFDEGISSEQRALTANAYYQVSLKSSTGMDSSTKSIQTRYVMTSIEPS